MGWDDRPYYRDRGASSNPLIGLLTGSVPLLSIAGVRIRAHSALIVFIAGMLLLYYTDGYELASKLVSMALLVVTLLIHEFGHSVAAKMVSGSTDEILLWPLGGLAFPDTPRRPLARFWTALGGPAANVVVCVATAAGVWLLADHTRVSLSPLHPITGLEADWRSSVFYCWWGFVVSYFLLLFNILPIFPLDGGHVVQSLLWPLIGYHRSMMISCTIGMCGSAGLGIFGIYDLNLMLVLLAACLFYCCYQQRVIQRETGPTEPWQSDEPDYAFSLSPDPPPKKRKLSRRAIRIARQHALEAAAERNRLDTILAKVSATGLKSLTWRERRALRRATERRRQYEVELKAMLDK